jgi:DNA-binding winged helix-turn-helix (wHTH) protein/TolB-like protein
MDHSPATVFFFGDFEIDPGRRLLKHNGRILTLKAKTFDLLCHLVENPGRVLSKDELLEQVWPDQFVEENNLTVQMSALRKALGETGDGDRIIATIPGKGYRFTADVRWGPDEDALIVEERTIERIRVDHEEHDLSLRGVSGEKRPRILLAVMVIAVLAAVGLGIFYLTRKPPVRIDSIAVLPFENRTDDPGNEYLSDGLAESVIYSLSRLPGVRVMSRNSVYGYKGKDIDARTIGSELNVGAILTGRVTKVGDTLRISSELTSADDNSVIWGEQFTRNLPDIEKLQADISDSISNKLKLRLSANAAPTENAEAYKTYLQALFYWNKRTPENLNKSIELFKAAIALDPEFAQAYGGLAMAYEVQPANGVFSPEQVAEIDRLTGETATKALELDPNMAEAHAVLGMRRMMNWDFVEAESSLKRSIEINPNFATGHQWYSELLSAVGRVNEAINEIQKAYALDPFSRAVRMNLALRYVSTREYDEAIDRFKKLIESEPDYPMAYFWLSTAYVEKGMLLESLEFDCKGDELLEIDPPGLCKKESEAIRAAFERDGPVGFWRESLKASQRLHKAGIMDDVTAAGAYFRAGDRDTGFQLLEKAYAEHSSHIVHIRDDPPFCDLGDDSRYVSLLKRIGLSK